MASFLLDVNAATGAVTITPAPELPVSPAPAVGPDGRPAPKPATTYSVIDHRGFVIFSHQSKDECDAFRTAPERNSQKRHLYRTALMTETATN